MSHHKRSHIGLVFALSLGFLVSPIHPAVATPVIKVEIRNHLFYPSRIDIPANTKVKLMIFNHDASSEEFESYELNREKVIPAGRRSAIFIGPLAPGTYPFFGEFHANTARGTIVAK